MLNETTPKQTSIFPNLFWSIVIIVLIIVSLFLGYQYFNIKTQLNVSEASIKDQNLNTKALDFTSFFIESVLMAEGEVDFETRLKLEGLVRDLDDKEILEVWNKFVNAPDGNIAQREVKTLLYLLVEKARN